MKYFIKENWLKTNSSNLAERDEASKDMHRRFDAYIPEFEKAKIKLSKRFLSIYEKYDHFHDWEICGMQYITSDDQKNDKYIINIKSWDLMYSIEFQKVKSLSMNLHKAEAFALYQLDEYSYDEWTLGEDGFIHYSLLMLSFSELDLVCERVVLRKINNGIKTPVSI